jgi:predicted N-formylglutamate amidohydrolase
MIPIVVSCEHATCAVPDALKEVLHDDLERITTPEGWDPGALNLAQAMAMKFRTPLVHCEVSRLIIDCHLQDEDPQRWSDCSMKLTELQREKLHERQLIPHLSGIRQRIATELVRSSSVLHVSVHTFDPTCHPDLHIALLHSEGRAGEAAMAMQWLSILQEKFPQLEIRTNESFYPDNTKTLLDTLRKERSSAQYQAIELQVSNQFFLEGAPMKWDQFKTALIESLRRLLESSPNSP